MSDVDLLLGALPRILAAARSRFVEDPDGGRRVTGHQARVLLKLDENDPTMVGELAEFLGVTPSTMSLTLKRLEEADCITRSRDPDDRRVMNVRLTEAGRRIRDAWSLLDAGRVDALLRQLRPDERTRAMEGLSLLAEGADRLAAQGEAYLEALTSGGIATKRDQPSSR
jgi:DNA-binding MarR family transcriptional regulator